mgnify:FL=1
MPLTIFLFSIIGLLGILILIATFKNPSFFWPLLIIISVGTGGLIIGGYPLVVDEFFLFFLLVGAFLSLFLARKKDILKEKRNPLSSFHLMIFYLFVFYMIFQTARGFFAWEGDLIQLGRWLLYYSMLGLLTFVLAQGRFSYFDKKKAVLLIYGTAFFYSLFYLFHGSLSELLRGVNRFSLQGYEWSGTSTATFPFLIASLSALFLLREKSLNYRLLGVSWLVLGIIVSIYYHSRVSLFAIVIFMVLIPFLFEISRKKKIIFLAIIILIAISLIWLIAGPRFKDYYEIAFQGEKKYEIWAREGGDIDRYMYARSALSAVQKDLKSFLFGYGLRAHRSVLIPYLQDFYDKYQKRFIAEEPVRAQSFNALLVDGGWIGMILFLSNFLIVALVIFQQKNDWRKLLLFSALPILFFWLFVTNLGDMLLLYLLIMPSGLLIKLSQDEPVPLNND